MCELEALLQQFYELARQNPGLIFRIHPPFPGEELTPSEDIHWTADFTKGEGWWASQGELKEVIQVVLDNFEATPNYEIHTNPGNE